MTFPTYNARPDDEGGARVAPIGSASDAKTIYFAAFGAALPFLTIAVGWWIADASLKDSDDAAWDRAGNCVYAATCAAMVIGSVCCIPLFRHIHGLGRGALAIVVGVVYVVGLFFFNLWAYFKTSGPFP